MDITNTHSCKYIFVLLLKHCRINIVVETNAKISISWKYLAGSNYSPKTTFQVVNNNLGDYFVKSKYGKVLQTVLYINKIELFF